MQKLAGFGWNVNAIIKDVNDHGNVNTALIQEAELAVLDIQPEEFNEGKHSYK